MDMAGGKEMWALLPVEQKRGFINAYKPSLDMENAERYFTDPKFKAQADSVAASVIISTATGVPLSGTQPPPLPGTNQFVITPDKLLTETEKIKRAVAQAKIEKKTFKQFTEAVTLTPAQKAKAKAE